MERITVESLSNRQLNRATLARQLLLEREARSAEEVIGHLVGLNAQDPEPPYVGLWSRIRDAQPDALETLLHDRTVVRGSLFRGTQHIVLARDYWWIQELLRPMLVRVQRNAFGRATSGIDPEELVATAHSLLADGPLTRPDLGRALAEKWPDRDPMALARSVQFLTTVVHPPPDGTWEWRGKTPFLSAARWLGAPPEDAPDDPAQRLVLRYLAAFGPASTRDVQAWSGLTGLRHAIAELRPRLQVFRSEEGRELFDLPDAPRPDPDVDAPVRFLAPLDNVLLAHHDRNRVVDDEQRRHTFLEAAMTLDGFVHGLWRVRHVDTTATLIVRVFQPVPKRAKDEVISEGLKLLRFVALRADEQDVRFHEIDSPWPPGTPWSCWPKKAARRSR
ncbi:winged helix DNA-binding domain-containing protein [Mumia sp. DW29H23]|uniref:winged helix DNA-binding domain-containing protein n=1 Tax=Mumia sp. DW29H23 TaxID=3421241 RepID=UPI003D6954A4